jgi:hypothetical protein
LLLLLLVLVKVSSFLLSQCTQLLGEILLLPRGRLQQTRKDLPACCYCIPLLLGQLEYLNSSKELFYRGIAPLLLLLILLLPQAAFVSADGVVDPGWLGESRCYENSSVV